MESGQTIAGKYRLNRLLGTGGMASVWSATNVFTEREFAIKFMLPQVARTPEAARRFLLEAKVSARINHPNIIEVIDVGQAEDSSLFLVMELLTGASLDVAVRQHKPAVSVFDFMVHMRLVAEALAAAHRSGVIHRDLKPTNIFLHNDRDGRIVPKILDFGVSKILEEENNTSLTVVGTVLGSPLYMSPEQAMGAEGIDGRTDIFAYGSILFESLTGQRAYDGPNFNALIVTIATTEPRRIDDVAPELPDPLRALIRECLITNKTRRLDSFERVVERLDGMMPELEKQTGPLPYARRERAAADAEEEAAAATKAMPATHVSERPPPPSSIPPSSGSRSENPTSAGKIAAVSGLAAPTDSISKTRTWLGAVDLLPGAAQPRSTITVMAGAVMAALAVVLGIAALFGREGSSPHAAVQGSALSATAGIVTPKSAAQAPVDVDPPSQVPLISVDSLPVASTRKAEPSRAGKLSINASPGSCSVSIDGVKSGATPLIGMEIQTGLHRLECAPASGRTKTANVNVSEGATTHYRFALEE
jgi:eukaryotic-like serine/threonine-protein kinase